MIGPYARFCVRAWLFAPCLTGCGGSSPEVPHRTDPQFVEREERVMFQAYADAQRREGLLGELPYLDGSATFFWVPPGYGGPIGIDSVHAVLRRNASGLHWVDPSGSTCAWTS